MKAGTIVCRRGQQSESMFFIVRGWIDEIKYFKQKQANRWTMDLARTKVVSKTTEKTISAVVNQLGPKSYVVCAAKRIDSVLFPASGTSAKSQCLSQILCTRQPCAAARIATYYCCISPT